MDAVVTHEPRARRFVLPGRGGEMAALEFGPDERPIDIVFSHANSFDARAYRTILAPLAGELRILAVDIRGHGRTRLPTPTEGRVSWNDMRDDLLALLELLDLKDVLLAGHSLGGTLSLLAAALAPERVRKAVMLDPVILPQELIDRAKRGELMHGQMIEQAQRRRRVFPDRESAYRAYHGRGAFKTWSDAMLADYLVDGLRERPDGQVELACSPEWEASSYGAQGNDSWDALRDSRCPVLILKAEHASPCRVTPEDAAAIGPGRIEVRAIAGTTHFLPMERPDLVREALAG